MKQFDPDKYSPKLMRASLILQSVYCGLCLLGILLLVISTIAHDTEFGRFILFKVFDKVIGCLILGMLPVILINFGISILALPSKPGEKRTRWSLWIVLSPLLTLGSFFVLGLVAAATGGV